ncbi:hypothetical protein [Maribacter cobaltidurans]|uniref:Uncharacterized protein n=1 Tax=Maribacter cobaltidurans TaxID=1178778 RepID=A0A223V935_9FLAO|nr:hypothetical protein [Maribacter cobaltidurans]ASV31389.1 hypothetical protein CJ263_14840 [Maribacter cobaltidurans]GGD82678.1 hypothetical protein GCM10011412_20560 [Maribacter cobaltidurans]
MNPNYIEFKKQRELGEILTDTFAFIRKEFKPFFSTFFKIVGPFLAVMIVALVAYLYFIGNSFNFLVQTDNGAASFATIFVVGLAYVLSAVAVYTMSQSTVLHYIKSYNSGKGQTDFDTIKQEVYASFWSFIGLGIIVGLSVGVGFLFCLIPGIYLYVPLVLSFSIMVFDKIGPSDAYTNSFSLVKDEWWITFATLLVMGIILYIAALAFSVPTVIYQWLKMGIFTGEMDAENVFEMTSDPIYILFNVISTIAQFLLNLISIIATALIYFNLNEKKNFTGTLERIENLGKTTED